MWKEKVGGSEDGEIGRLFGKKMSVPVIGNKNFIILQALAVPAE